MKKELIKLINSFKGNVLAIGIDDNLADAIDKNDLITNCDILNYVSSKTDYKETKQKKMKTIDIKKIRKIYKKKKIDYIICEYNQIEKYLNSFVKDSVYINSSKLYFYGNFNEQLLLKKYKRYTNNINLIYHKKDVIIEIDNTNTKNNIFKEFFYKIIDGVSNLIEIIGDVLMG